MDFNGLLSSSKPWDYRTKHIAFYFRNIFRSASIQYWASICRKEKQVPYTNCTGKELLRQFVPIHNTLLYQTYVTEIQWVQTGHYRLFIIRDGVQWGPVRLCSKTFSIFWCEKILKYIPNVWTPIKLVMATVLKISDDVVNGWTSYVRPCRTISNTSREASSWKIICCQ